MSKRKREQEKPMPEPIKLDKAAREKVAPRLERLQFVQEEFKSFIQGVALGLKVPDGWRFNALAMAFMPPEEKGD